MEATQTTQTATIYGRMLTTGTVHKATTTTEGRLIEACAKNTVSLGYLYPVTPEQAATAAKFCKRCAR